MMIKGGGENHKYGFPQVSDPLMEKLDLMEEKN
jgi:hypothetical protein